MRACVRARACKGVQGRACVRMCVWNGTVYGVWGGTVNDVWNDTVNDMLGGTVNDVSVGIKCYSRLGCGVPLNGRCESETLPKS